MRATSTTSARSAPLDPDLDDAVGLLLSDPPGVRAHARAGIRVTGSMVLVADLAAVLGTMAALRAAGVPSSWLGGVSLAGAAILSSALSGVYVRAGVRLHKANLPDIAALLQMGLLITVVLGALTAGSASSAHIAATATSVVAAVGLARHAVQRLAGLPGRAERCLVIGEPDRVSAFRRQLAVSGTILDLVDTVPLARVGVGSTRRSIEDLIATSGAERVVVLDDDPVDRAAQVARRARNAGATVTLVPRLAATLGAEVVPELVGGCVAFSAGPAALRPSQAVAKRLLDVVGSATLLLLVAPAVAVIALAIKLDSPGPVLFRQERIGRDGRTFFILKFRTMVEDAEALKDRLRDRSLSDELFKVYDDPRATRVGRLLRRTSLDELPQLVNVLRGDMSLVGPRPLIPDEDGLIDGWHRDRLRLAPGMTGPWQVMGSARIGLSDMVMLDHHYVSNWSLWGDAEVILRTIAVVLLRRGI